MKNLLVALDGSSTSEKAAEYAMQIAKGFGCKAYLVCIVEHSAYLTAANAIARNITTNSAVQAYQEYQEQLRYAQDSILDPMAEKFRAAGIEVQTILGAGNPAQGIIEAATENEVDLIVIGSRGLSITQRLMIGSVSNAVMNKAKCNVCLIKD